MSSIPNPPIPPALAPGTARLAAALAKVQAKLPKLERDRTVEVQQKNGGTYSYSYVTLANLSEAVLPLLAEHGLSFTAMPGRGTDGKMAVTYRLMHESGESLTGEFPVSGDGGIQMIGGRITYARRYCLAAVVGIAADEDDESSLAQDGQRPAQRAAAKSRGKASGEQGGTVQRSAAPAGRPPLPGESATDPQLKKAVAMFNAIGCGDRDDRLRASSAIVGRPLLSAKEMTKAEASTLIDTLERVAKEPEPLKALARLVDADAVAAETQEDGDRG